jgi:acyl-CoA hydrolase
MILIRFLKSNRERNVIPMDMTKVIAGYELVFQLRIVKRMNMNVRSIDSKLSIVKTPADSETVMTKVVYPNDANPMGMLQGGKLVQWMDTASAICAQTHAGAIAVTALMDKAVFKKPAKIGDIVTVKAKITRAFDASMEIFVQAWTRSVTNPVNQHIGECFFTFVALNNDAKPANVPKLEPQSASEVQAFNDALVRKSKRNER